MGWIGTSSRSLGLTMAIERDLKFPRFSGHLLILKEVQECPKLQSQEEPGNTVASLS